MISSGLIWSVWPMEEECSGVQRTPEYDTSLGSREFGSARINDMTTVERPGAVIVGTHMYDTSEAKETCLFIFM